MRFTGLTGPAAAHRAAADSRLTDSGAAGSAAGQAPGEKAANPAAMGTAGTPDTISAVAPGPISPAVMAAMNRARHFSRPATSSPAGKFNVGEPHSPQLLRELSGPLSKTGRPGHAVTPAKTAAPSSAATAAAPSSTATVPPAPGAAATASPAAGPTATPAPSSTTGANRTMLAAPAATSAAASAGPPGVDVSYVQGAVNWTQVAGAGIKFAAVKATEGNYYPSASNPNTYYASNFSGAKNAGLYVASYHFANPHVSGGVNQADFAVANSSGNYTADGRTLPLFLDLEYDPYSTNKCYLLTQSQMVSWISAFAGEAQRLTGQLPIIYTTADWWNTCTGDTKAFASDQLWIAAYSAPPPALPAAWPNWTFWQYTSSATVPGITGNVDESYFNSNLIDLIDPGTQRDVPGSAASVQVNSLNATAGQSLTFTAAGLPAGLSISPAGQITGTISAAPGADKVVVTGTNPSSGATGSTSFVWEVPGAVTVTSPGAQATTVGGAADLQVQATDTAAGYSPSFTAAGLPPGVSISSTGRISGWPTTAGTYSVTVTGTDAMNISGSATFSWTVSPASAQGPAAQIWLQNGGKCLDDPNGSTASGTRLQVWRCLGNANQRWTVVQDGTLRINGACLAEAGTGNGAAVVLGPCNGTSAQRWQVGTSGQLVNTASGRCLDDTGWQTANGTLVQIWACGGGAEQHWIPAAAAIMSGIPGKCLDDPGFKTANGTRPDIWSCAGSSNENWTVEPDGSIRVFGKCLDVAGAGTASGSWVDLYTCVGAGNQHWKIVPMGPLGSQVVNPASGKCLADTGDATVNGSKLTIQPCPQAQDPGTTWHVL
jgi:GH25 family lysozyme M1 (1,4-beta-N-acetylmuramidase)